MGHGNGRITAPVNTDDVSAVLNVASHDIATLCGSERINPASKFKPIRKTDQYESLSDADRRFQGWLGNGNDVYYGVRIAVSPARIFELDSSSVFEYFDVRPGVDYARIDDFEGYDHNAVFNPNGTVADTYILDADLACPVGINYFEYTSTGFTGIDLRDILNRFSAGVDFGSYYPCAMVRLSNNRKFVRALWNTKESPSGPSDTRGFTRLKDGDALWKNWSVMPPPTSWGLKTNDIIYITVFFVSQIYSSSSWDIRSAWKEITSTFAVALPFVLPCPGAVAVRVKVSALISRGIEVTSVGGQGGVSVMAVQFRWLDDAEDGVTYRVVVTVRGQTSSTVGSGTFSYTYPATLPQAAVIQATGLAGGLVKGATYSYSFSVTNSKAPLSTCNSGVGSFKAL